MSLREEQSEFARAVAKLLDYIHNMGYECTLGDCYRDARLHGEMGVKRGYGAASSFHKLRLAIDINLFRDGVYLDKTLDHKVIGDWWMRTHPKACWGGLFGDGNHYSWGECRNRPVYAAQGAPQGANDDRAMVVA